MCKGEHVKAIPLLKWFGRFQLLQYPEERHKQTSNFLFFDLFLSLFLLLFLSRCLFWEEVKNGRLLGHLRVHCGSLCNLSKCSHPVGRSIISIVIDASAERAGVHNNTFPKNITRFFGLYPFLAMNGKRWDSARMTIQQWRKPPIARFLLMFRYITSTKELPLSGATISDHDPTTSTDNPKTRRLPNNMPPNDAPSWAIIPTRGNTFVHALIG